jgi:hypothetical protein
MGGRFDEYFWRDLARGELDDVVVGLGGTGNLPVSVGYPAHRNGLKQRSPDGDRTTMDLAGKDGQVGRSPQKSFAPSNDRRFLLNRPERPTAHFFPMQ